MRKRQRKEYKDDKYASGKWICIILYLCVVLSCGRSTSHKNQNLTAFGESGMISVQLEKTDSIMWEDHRQKIILRFINGKVDEVVLINKEEDDENKLSFWDNNRLKNISYYSKGFLMGRSYTFDDDQGLAKYQYFVKLKDTSILNEHQFFFEGNQIDKSSSNYYDVYYDSDSVMQHTSFNFTIVKHGGLFNGKLRMIIGEYNENYELIIPSNNDTIECIDGKCLGTYIPQKTGEIWVRGKIQEYRTSQGQETILNTYFSIPIISY